MPTTVTAAVAPCMKRHIYNMYQDTINQPLPHFFSPAMGTCCFLISYLFYLPLKLSRPFLYLFLPTLLQVLLALSFCLSLPVPLEVSLSLLVLSTPLSTLLPLPPLSSSTPIVEIRQAIYIFLHGCLTSHSLNKVLLYCFCTCICTIGQCVNMSLCMNWCVWYLIGGYNEFVFVYVFIFLLLMICIWESGKSSMQGLLPCVCMCSCWNMGGGILAYTHWVYHSWAL